MNGLMIKESNIHYIVMLIVLIDNIIHTGCHKIQYHGITQENVSAKNGTQKVIIINIICTNPIMGLHFHQLQGILITIILLLFTYP